MITQLVEQGLFPWGFFCLFFLMNKQWASFVTHVVLSPGKGTQKCRVPQSDVQFHHFFSGTAGTLFRNSSMRDLSGKRRYNLCFNHVNGDCYQVFISNPLSIWQEPDEGTIFSQIAPYPLETLTVCLLPIIHLFLPIYLCPLYVFAATRALPLLHPSPSQTSAPFLPRQISLGKVALPPV